MFSEANLKAKSLSTNEIFLPVSPMVSRSGSVSRIHRKPLTSLTINYETTTKPASYHGSFENLERKIELTVPKTTNTLNRKSFQEENVYNCPFVNNCTTKIKG